MAGEANMKILLVTYDADKARDTLISKFSEVVKTKYQVEVEDIDLLSKAASQEIYDRADVIVFFGQTASRISGFIGDQSKTLLTSPVKEFILSENSNAEAIREAKKTLGQRLEAKISEIERRVKQTTSAQDVFISEPVKIRFVLDKPRDDQGFFQLTNAEIDKLLELAKLFSAQELKISIGR